MSDDPQDAKGIFLGALDIQDPAERPVFVERSCGGDAALRKRVEDLLRAYGQPDGPIDKLAATLPPTITPEAVGERIGDLIAGRYKLLESLGQGGMGAVFMAQQTQPVKRVVALKLIKLGMDSKQVLARFEAERQALALMDHPNIAKVLDAGATESGRPFFVMELVKGVPITRFCDERHLSPRQRLELFIPVCQAIQHAHQKGIIHRDIKPTNVLVALYDDRPVPKVIDFGVAKAAGLQLTEASLMTGFGAIVGTPEYMSPEQAQFNQLDIDTRSDVYALGVLLYELLTGTTPIDRKRLNQGALFEVLRMIREEEPPRPSTRLSTSDALASIASTRGTEPTKLAKLMRGELDWIVMKCLEKDRSRRYETANGLARDLEHYLRDEVVEAQPPTAAYRLRKFVRKQRAALTTAATIVLLLLAGVAVSTWQAVRATRAEFQVRHERDAAKAARDETERTSKEVFYALGVAAAEKAVAEERLGEAVAARKEAETQRDNARVTAYASGMQLASRAWQDNIVPRARELLEEVPKSAAGRDLRGFEWYYLSRVCHSELRTLEGHTHSVMAVAYSPNGQTLASASADQTVKLWDSASGKELLTLVDHGGPVFSVAFSPDGRCLASGVGGGPVKIWDSATGKQLVSFNGGVVQSVAFSPDGKRLAVGSQDQMKIWDSATGKELLSLPGYGHPTRESFSRMVWSVVFSPDGKRLAVGSADNTLRIWDSRIGKELLSLKGHGAVAFSPDGQRLASQGDDDNTVKIWDSATGKDLLTLKGHSDKVWSVRYSPDGRQLASASHDKTVKIWDSATGRKLATLKGHGGEVNCVAFSPDGRRFASGSDDRTVKIWDSATRQEPFSLKGDGGPASGVAFSPDGQRLASVNNDNTVKIWDCTTGKEMLSHKGKDAVAFSPDGQRLASGSEDGQAVKVWDSATGKELLSLKLKWGPRTVAFSPDGKRLASADRDSSVKIWDSVTGKELLFLEGTGAMVCNVAFSPDGKRLAGGYNYFTVKIWESATGKELFSLKSHLGEITSVAFSPDGRRLASGSVDDTATIWDSATGKELFSLKGHAGPVMSTVFSPDGRRLASGSRDGTVKLWDTETGKELLTLNRHAGTLSSVAFSPDGKCLASVDKDGAVDLWETSVSPETQQRRAAQQAMPVGSLFKK